VGIHGAGGFSMTFQAGTKLVNTGTKKNPIWVTVSVTALQAINEYLPAGGTADKLTVDLVNPDTSAAGVSGGQVLALKLNIALSDGGATPAGLGDLYYHHAGDSLDGMTARQILAVAEIAIGGGALPAGYSYSTLSALCANLDLSWDTVVGGICQPSAWAVTYLSVLP